MSSKNSITTSQGPGGPKKIGSPRGGTGSSDLWKSPEAVILTDDQLRAMKRLNALRVKFFSQKGWPRKRLSEQLTSENRRSSISILKSLSDKMGYMPALEITRRVFAHDPKWSTAASEEIFQDWARTLASKSAVFVMMAYEWAIRQPKRWTPSLGEFIQIVDSYQSTLDLIEEDLR